MQIKFRGDRCCRRSGGLIVGASLHFPVTVSTPKKFGEGDYGTEVFSYVTLSLGLVFWRVAIDFLYDHFRRDHS